MNAEVYLGDIVGVTEVIDAGGSLTEVKWLSVIDDELEITIDEPEHIFAVIKVIPNSFCSK